jgi:cbb3-type cytochrome oxidase subunit 1
VFLGDATGHEHFALPVYSSALLMLSGLAMAFKHLLVVHYRSDRSFHPAQLLLSAGVFWFLWVLATAIVVLQCKPVAGIAQLVVARWYANGVFQVVLGAGGLGTLMYFLPQLMGRPLASRELAVTAFWTLLIVGGWTGLSGRWPLPVWIGGVSSIAAFMMLVPLLAVGVNIWQTVRPDFGRVVGSTQGRFFLIGAASYLVWLAVHVAFGANSFNELLGQTHFESAREVLFIYGFVAAVGIGAVSVILPRLAGVECNCSGVKIIFQLLIAGLLLSVIGFGLAGAAQGTAWANGSLDFAAVNRVGGGMLQLALVGLGLLTLAAAMFLVGTTVVMLRSIYAEYPVLKWTEDEQVEQTEKVTA